MKQKERDRLKLVAYEAYMAGQARGQKTEVILEKLGKKFHRDPRTIQNWIYDVCKERETKNQVEVLRDEANAKCRKDDHSWFDDSRFEGIAYRCEHSDKVGDFGNIREMYITKTCYFCGHRESGLVF